MQDGFGSSERANGFDGGSRPDEASPAVVAALNAGSSMSWQLAPTVCVCPWC